MEVNYEDLVGAFASLWIVLLAVSIFSIVVMWKIFEKAGKEGWRAIVPFYNTYTLCEITWGNGWYMLILFAAFIPLIGAIVVFVFFIMTLDKLSKSFGKSTGFTVGLFFLSIVFLAILAFDKNCVYTNLKTTNNSGINPAPQNTVQNVQPSVNAQMTQSSNGVQPAMNTQAVNTVQPDINAQVTQTNTVEQSNQAFIVQEPQMQMNQTVMSQQDMQIQPSEEITVQQPQVDNSINIGGNQASTQNIDDINNNQNNMF